MDAPRSIELTDPRALRALAHPTRLSLLGLLRREGPQTATSAAAVIGESSGSCSFHLRQLEKYGLVEQTGGGVGRSKPWRATADYTSWPTVASTPEIAAATELLTSVVVERQAAEWLDWVHRRAQEPEEWQRAAEHGDAVLYLTADELTDFNARTWALAMEFDARRGAPSLRPAGARPVRYLQVAFPAAATGDGS